jgi:hypothetical protein
VLHYSRSRTEEHEEEEQQNRTTIMMNRRNLSIYAVVVLLATTTLWEGAHAFAPRQPAMLRPTTTTTPSWKSPAPPQQQLQHATRGTSSTALALGPSGFGLAAITGAISGGFFAGSLHAIAGT